MKKIKSIFIFIIFLQISINGFSQTNCVIQSCTVNFFVNGNFTPFFIFPPSPKIFDFSGVASSKALTLKQPVLKPFEGIHYTAFFCRMELKAVKSCNVWLKVHAGDYDNYAVKRPLSSYW
jgi:hypothetical protein